MGTKKNSDPPTEAPHYALKRRALNKAIRVAPTLLGAGLGGIIPKSKSSRALGAILGGGLGEVIGRKQYKKKIIRDVREGKMYDVDSSMIRNMVDTPHGLYVRFNTGNLYRYPDAGKQERIELMKQDSIGRAFNKTIKGKHEYEKL